MKRIVRQQLLSAEEAAKYQEIRDQVDKELPELLTRHYERVAAWNNVDDVLEQLKSARERQGISLADLSERIGMDASAVSKLEAGELPNATVATLVRYADAVGMRLELSLIAAN